MNTNFNPLKRCVLCCVLFCAQALADTGEIVVHINSALDNKGVIHVYLLNSEAQFVNHKNSFKQCSQTISNRKITCHFNNIPFSQYAIFAYQDRNQDNDLNTNLLGIPSEKMAVSAIDLLENDHPNFTQSKFKFESISAQIFLNLQ